MEKSIKFKQNFLFLLLVFSQNLTWKFIMLIPNIDEMAKKTMPFIQVFCSALYIFLTVITTADREIYIEYIEKNPMIKKFLDAFMKLIFSIFSWGICALIIPLELCDANKEDVPRIADQNKKGVEDMINNLNSQRDDVRILEVISCLFLILLFVSFFLDEIVLSYIADFCSMICAIISGMFVARNIRKFDLSQIQPEIDNDSGTL